MTKRYIAGTSKIVLLSFLMLAFIAGAQAVCNDCTLQVIPVQNNLCQGESAIFDIRVVNAFPQSKAISFTAQSDIGLDSDLTSTIVLDAYETKTFRVTFYPKQVEYGEHRLTIIATGLGVQDSDDALFYINDCYNMEVCGTTDLEVCEGAVGALPFTVTNTGTREDSYAISVSGVPPALEVTPSQDQVTIPAGGSKDLYLNVKALNDRYDDYQLQINVVSIRNSVIKTVKASLVDCHQLTLDAPQTFKTCPDAGLTYTAKISNNGRLTEDYTLGVSGDCHASISPESVRLAPGESRQILVSLPPSLGQCDLTLTAQGQYNTASASTHVDVVSCYGVDLELIPPVMERCNGETAPFVAKVTNTGYLRDTYTMTFTGIPTDLNGKSVILDPSQSTTLNFNITETWCTPNDIPFKVTAKGHASDSEDGLLRFLPPGERCAGIKIIPSTAPMQIDCAGGTYKFIVYNNGYVGQAIQMSVEGPGNAFVQPSELLLMPTEGREAALYIERPQGMSEANYTIIAKSGDKEDRVRLRVDFSGPVCMIYPPGAKEETPSVVLLPPPSVGDILPKNETPTGAVTTGGDDSSLLLVLGLLIIGVILVLVAVFMPRPKEEDKIGFFPEASGPKPPEPMAVKKPSPEEAAKRREEIKEAILRAAG